MTINNTHNRQISMPRVGFELTNAASESPKTHALDRAATGISMIFLWRCDPTRIMASSFLRFSI
jgi:hypothetical protein